MTIDYHDGHRQLQDEFEWGHRPLELALHAVQLRQIVGPPEISGVGDLCVQKARLGRLPKLGGQKQLPHLAVRARTLGRQSAAVGDSTQHG